MNNIGAFSEYHPFSLMIYYISVLTVAVFSSNPVFVALTFIGGMLHTIFLSERKEYVKRLLQYFFLIVILSLINPLFSHHGETPLLFMNGKPITFQALVYGVCMSFTVVGVLTWCSSLSKVFTSEKIIYLVGKPLPKLALTISIVLRFIPLFKRKFMKIHNCQVAMGMYFSDGIFDRVITTLKIFSAEITWALESSIDTSISMRSRGYGLPGRTAFSLFIFRKKDVLLLLTNVILFLVVIVSIADKSSYFYFYPSISELPTGLTAVAAYTAYGVLVLIPFIIDLKEVLTWRYLRSKI